MRETLSQIPAAFRRGYTLVASSLHNTNTTDHWQTQEDLVNATQRSPWRFQPITFLMWGNSAHYHTTHSKSNLLCVCKWVCKENNCDMKWADTFPGRFTTGADSVWPGTRARLTRGDDYLNGRKEENVQNAIQHQQTFPKIYLSARK